MDLRKGASGPNGLRRSQKKEGTCASICSQSPPSCSTGSRWANVPVRRTPSGFLLAATQVTSERRRASSHLPNSFQAMGSTLSKTTSNVPFHRLKRQARWRNDADLSRAQPWERQTRGTSPFHRMKRRFVTIANVVHDKYGWVERPGAELTGEASTAHSGDVPPAKD